MPAQTVKEGFAVTEVGIVEIVLTITEAVKHPVVLQAPSALTK